MVYVIFSKIRKILPSSVQLSLCISVCYTLSFFKFFFQFFLLHFGCFSIVTPRVLKSISFRFTIICFRFRLPIVPYFGERPWTREQNTPVCSKLEGHSTRVKRRGIASSALRVWRVLVYFAVCLSPILGTHSKFIFVFKLDGYYEKPARVTSKRIAKGKKTAAMLNHGITLSFPSFPALIFSLFFGKHFRSRNLAHAKCSDTPRTRENENTGTSK